MPRSPGIDREPSAPRPDRRRHLPADINGAARFTARLATGLAGRGDEVHVVAPSDTGPASSPARGDGVTVVHLDATLDAFEYVYAYLRRGSARVRVRRSVTSVG
jgi:hypothetical protein